MCTRCEGLESQRLDNLNHFSMHAHSSLSASLKRKPFVCSKRK